MATALVDNGSLENLKHVDSAIVLFSSSTDMTRYDKADLLSLKEAKSSQQPPSCYYDPNIIRLNIFKYQNQHTEEMEAQMRAFREKLQNLSWTSFDPSIMQLLRRYHNALLHPSNNPLYSQPQVIPQPNPMMQSMQQQAQPSPRRVSFLDKQQAVLDKIPSYDRNMNFFDNITTTATMRPPPRMGVNSYSNNGYNNNNNSNNYKRPNFNSQNLRKPNSCATEHANSYSSSVGYFSANDTKSSCEESLLEKPCEKRMSAFDQINAEKMANSHNNSNNNHHEKKSEEEEKEPEWFSVPASLNDFIDLHGFDDDLEAKSSGESSKHSAEAPKNSQPQRRNSFNNSYNRYHQNNSYNNNRNMSYRPNQSYQAPQVNNNANQRFRNPLHFNKPANMNPPKIVNPFFEAWRNGKFLNQKNVSFTDLMGQNQYPKNLPSSAVYMSDVENRMKQQQNLHGMSQIAPPTDVPQFFNNLANNWGVRVNDMPQNNMYNPQQNIPGPTMDGYQMPTHQQLQQFTSEIMRNAILRKNQHYHDENNFQN